MIISIFPSLAVAAIGLFAARAGDRLLKYSSSAPCAKKEKRSVVWSYKDAPYYTAASSSPRSAAKRVVSSSPR